MKEGFLNDKIDIKLEKRHHIDIKFLYSGGLIWTVWKKAKPSKIHLLDKYGLIWIKSDTFPDDEKP